MAYQEITSYNSPNYTPASQSRYVFGYPRSIVGVVYHWWGNPDAGATFNGVINWLCRANGNSSAHVVGEGGRVAWIVNADDVAWHAGHPRGNAQYLGYECNPRLSDADYETMGEFHYNCEKYYGRRLEVRLHKEFQNTSCSPIDVNRIRAIADRFHAGNKPAPQPQPQPAPKPEPEKPEWIKNLKDITAQKLTVMPADGTKVINLTNNTPVNGNIIPRGTQIDIARETVVGGKKYYISSYAANKGLPWGILTSDLGIPAEPPVNDKPEWLKNLKDIEDKDMWTRSETPVLNLEDGKIVEKLAINTKVRITHATFMAEQDLLVLEGGKTAIQTIYLSDKPIEKPNTDIDYAKENNTLLKKLIEMVAWVIEKLKNIFK